MSEQTKVSSDIYDLTDYVNKMKKKHIPVDNEDTLYVSTFGYIGEMLANLLQNTVITASEYSNEAIPTRAKFDRNVIIHAMTLGVDKVHAVPATMDVQLLIPVSVVDNNLGNKKSETRRADQFVLDRTITYSIEGVEFHLDYDIIITRIDSKQLTSSAHPIYTARYDMSYKNPTSNIQDPILPTVAYISQAAQDGGDILVVNTHIRQTMYTEIEEVISANNDIINKTINFSFENQMAYFDVAVYEGNSTEPKRVLTPIYDGLYTDNVMDYCYYSYINASNIRIRFDKNSYKPSINDKIIIRVYTTLGSDGNFKYNIDNKFILPSTSNVEYTSAYVLMRPNGDGSVNGINRSTTKELQNIIPKEMLSRGFITTLSDLRNYFNSLSNENSIIYTFRKEDNFLRRSYYAYSLMKDDANNVIPTNTCDICLPNLNLSDMSRSEFIMSGDIFVNAWNSTTEPTNIIYKLDDFNFGDAPASSAYKNCRDRYLVNVFNVNDANGTHQERFVCKCYEVKKAADGDYYEMRCTYIQNDSNVSRARKYGLEDIIINEIPLKTNDTRYVGYWGLPPFVYTSPCTLEITPESAGNHTSIVKYYVDIINESKIVNTEYVNDESDIQFICNKILVKRNSFISENKDEYYITIGLLPNLDLGTMQHPEYHIQCIAVYKNKETGKPIGFSDGIFMSSDKDTGSLKYAFRFCVTEMAHDGSIVPYDSYSRLLIDDVFAPNNDTENGIPVRKDAIQFDANVDMEIYTLFKYDDGAYKTIAQLYAENPEDIAAELVGITTAGLNFPVWVSQTEKVHFSDGDPGTTFKTATEKFPGRPYKAWYDSHYEKAVAALTDDRKYQIKDMVITNKYKVTNGINLFYNRSDIMTSYVEPKLTTGGAYVRRVPMVKYNYMNSEERVNYFMTEFRKDSNYIISALPKLETLFNIDHKLFNTYGKGTMYHYMNANGGLGEQIPAVSFGLNFRTKLYNDSDKAIIEQIKNDIKDYIEDISEMREIHMPNLVTMITKKYGEYFVFFEYVGIDYEGTTVDDVDAREQHIITNEDLENLGPVPEFLNVQFNELTGMPDINISIIS